MSGTFSEALEINLLNHVFAGTNYPPPSAIFIALYTAAPSASGGGTEVSGGAYVRMPVTFSSPTGNPPLINNPTAVQWAGLRCWSIFLLSTLQCPRSLRSS